jgi:FlaA1/EpsC-like NDP-sugar epimerase
MLANPTWDRNPVAFIDDNAAIRAQRILGVPVRGCLDDLDAVLRRVRIEEVVLSSPAITSSIETRVREICGAHGVPVRRLHLDIQ